jgi:hypothetical protein
VEAVAAVAFCIIAFFPSGVPSHRLENNKSFCGTHVSNRSLTRKVKPRERAIRYCPFDASPVQRCFAIFTVLSLLSDQFDLHGLFWGRIDSLDFFWVGILIIAIFVCSWIGSIIAYRLLGYRQLEDASITPSLPAGSD